MTAQELEAQLVGGPVFVFIELPTERDGSVWVNAAHISRVYRGEHGVTVRMTDSGILNTTLESPEQVMEIIQATMEAA